MKAKLIGFMPVNFKDDSGREISGTNIFVAYQDENVTGLRTEKFYVKNEIDLPADMKANDTLNISFNHKGKVEAILKA